MFDVCIGDYVVGVVSIVRLGRGVGGILLQRAIALLGLMELLALAFPLTFASTLILLDKYCDQSFD